MAQITKCLCFKGGRCAGRCEAVLIKLIEEHNSSIDFYINEVLPKELGSKNGLISMDNYFKGLSLIKAQGFHKKGMAILESFRALGFDVKMNMQSDKLIYKKL